MFFGRPRRFFFGGSISVSDPWTMVIGISDCKSISSSVSGEQAKSRRARDWDGLIVSLPFTAGNRRLTWIEDACFLALLAGDFLELLGPAAGLGSWDLILNRHFS